jgi:phospholipid/cholesterol/gamma-HCH transport system permease protein
VGPRPVIVKKQDWFAEVVSDVGAVGVLFVRTFRLLFTAKTDNDTLKLAHRYTNRSVTFIVTAMGFVGMIMVYQSTEQLSRAIGDTHLVGPSFIKLLIRVLGPTIVGMLIACRVGAGIAAEIGAMAVTDQLDAMRICFADPIEVLMVPRVRAGIIAACTLTVIGTAASGAAGFATAAFMYSVSAGTFWNFELVSVPDLIQGMTKALAYGIVIPIISGVFGFKAAGGARGVGRATTDAVVGSSFAIVLLDSVISLIGHVVGGR